MIKDLLQNAVEQLSESPTPQLDAEVLLAFLLKKDRTWLVTHLDEALSVDEITKYEELVKERTKGIPIAYITGKKAFWGMDFIVNESVLIPRPETEQLVEFVQEVSNEPKKILDIGTGSGCIAITLKKLYPKADVIGLDISKDALEIAKQNSENLHSQVIFLQSNLLHNYHGQKADLITANLPYLTREDLATSDTSTALNFEPESALLADDDGLALIKESLQQAVEFLQKNGWIFLELEPRQIPPLIQWIEECNLPYRIEEKKDLKQETRFLGLQLESKKYS